MATVHPSLNGHGYSKNPSVIADEIFSESIWAKKSQSDIYFDDIISLDYSIQEYPTDPNGLCTKLEEDYSTLFSRHFSDVAVRATAELPEGKDIFNVILKIRYSRDGMSFDFARVIEYYNGTLKQVLEILNND